MPLKRDLLIDRIKELSQAFGVSPTKALQESGAGKDFIANLKKGQSPSVDKIEMVAQYFNVSVDYLLGNDEMKKPAGVPDELWEELCKDEDKMRLAIWICQLSGEDLDRVEKLLDAALLSPPE